MKQDGPVQTGRLVAGALAPRDEGAMSIPQGMRSRLFGVYPSGSRTMSAPRQTMGEFMPLFRSTEAARPDKPMGGSEQVSRWGRDRDRGVLRTMGEDERGATP